MSADQPVTVTITRKAKSGHEAAFESALQVFIPKALGFPGHLGVHVQRPTPGTNGEYVVVIRFASGKHWQEFQRWSDYLQWTNELQKLLETNPHVTEQCGLESWFTLPGAKTQPVLPRYKMALLTWLGVFPTSTALAWGLDPWLSSWSFLLRSLLFSGLMVAALTWLVMPLLTRVFRSFLYPSNQGLHVEETSKDGKT